MSTAENSADPIPASIRRIFATFEDVPAHVQPRVAKNAEHRCDHCGVKMHNGLLHFAYTISASCSLHVCTECNALYRDAKDRFFVCDDCGDILPEEERTEEVDDRNLCQTCFDSDYFVCDDCGNVTHEDDRLITHDHQEICQSCYDDDYYTCGDCGEIFHSDNITWIESAEQMLCDSCLSGHFTRCSNCGEWIGDDRVILTNTCGSICPSCYENDYFTCEECDRDEGPIREYSYRPRWQYHATPGDKTHKPLFMGVELEVENKRREVSNNCAAGEMLHRLPAICKSDSSINNGFEIVFHPQTYNYAKGAKTTIDGALAYLRKNGFAGHNYGGMHVHLSKAAFTDLHLVKFARLFSNCRGMWTEISQRRTVNLDRWASFSNVPNDREVRLEKGACHNDDRYAALNFTGRTIEVRIFNSTIRTDRFFKNLEACQAAFDFSKAFGLRDMTHGQFASFVLYRRSEYPNLAAFMAEKGLFFGQATPVVESQLKHRAASLRQAAGF